MLAGNAELLRYVRKVCSPYNVNGLALECLPVALEDDAYVTWYADQVATGRERAMAGLSSLGVDFFPSHANFILMKIGPLHAELCAAMRTHGVLLRDRSTDPGCDGYVRITIGIEDHVTRGLAALKTIPQRNRLDPRRRKSRFPSGMTSRRDVPFFVIPEGNLLLLLLLGTAKALALAQS